MPSPLRFAPRLCAALIAFASAAMLPLPRAYAQAVPAASKSVDLTVFGAYSHSLPDYGPYANSGATFGFNITRYFHLPIAPSLEARANIDTGQTVRETSYLLGVRILATVFTRFHPYADFLVGPGDIHFDVPPSPGYLGDNSIVYNYGGGVDIDLTQSFSAKIDSQYQFWHIGNNDSLTPTVTSFGVVYHIPFRPHNKQSDIVY